MTSGRMLRVWDGLVTQLLCTSSAISVHAKISVFK